MQHHLINLCKGQEMEIRSKFRTIYCGQCVTVTGPAKEDTALEGVCEQCSTWPARDVLVNQIWARSVCLMQVWANGKEQSSLVSYNKVCPALPQLIAGIESTPRRCQCWGYKLDGRLHQFEHAHLTFTATVFNRGGLDLCLVSLQSSCVV